MRLRGLISLALLLAVASACTGEAPIPGPTASPSPPSPRVAPLVLDVVAATGGADGTVPRDEVGDDATYLEGMRVAVRDLNAHGGVNGRPVRLRFHDEGVDGPTTVLRETVAQQPLAILYVGPGPAVPSVRRELEATNTPLILLQGDLYTSRELFRQVFQTTIPWEWQVKVIARYLVRDRKADRIVFVGAGPEAKAAASAAETAVAYWGGSLSDSFTFEAIGLGSPPDATAKRIGGADAVIDFGPSWDTQVLIERLRRVGPIPRISGSQSLLIGRADTPFPPPGTTACYTYTWAGWARPIPRVDAFISAYQNGDPAQQPGGFEQEGFDAIRTLTLALQRTKGRGGGVLVEALEGIDKTFSGFPVNLGPDDHVFLPRDELGLFAVPGPDEPLDPWQGAGGDVWRALMRTFTYDGKRDNLLNRDRPIFFPGWRAPQPGPEYWKSLYGITTRPSDPLH
jgi:ABC-type branched-subunit amino acid transport system substrate-binding protein